MSAGERQPLCLAPLSAPDPLLQLAPELLNDVLDRPARAVAQAADRRPRHDADGLRDLIEDRQVCDAALPLPHAVGNLHHPARTFATGRTLTARLMSEKATNVIQNINNRHRLVDDRDRGGAQAEATNLAGAVEVERRIELGLGHQPHADAPGNARLRLAPLPDAAAVLVDQFACRDTQGQLDAARPVHMAAEAVELGTVAAGVARVLRVGRDTQRLKPVGPAVDDMCDAGQRLDVVHDRRLAEGALDGGERRLDARPAALALQALDQTRLLAADVRARAAVHVDVEVEVLAEDVVAQEVVRVAFVDGPLHGAIAVAIFVAGVDVGGAGARRVGGEEDALDDLVRVVLHEDAIVEGAGFALVGVDAEVDRAGMVRREEAPLDAAGEAGAAAAAQARRLD